MSDQIGFDEWARTHSRSGGVETSQAAGQSSRELARAQCAEILDCLVRSKEPLAAEQISDRIGLDTHRIGKRLPDLERAGKIAKTPRRHVNRSGRSAVKWWPR